MTLKLKTKKHKYTGKRVIIDREYFGLLIKQPPCKINKKIFKRYVMLTYMETESNVAFTHNSLDTQERNLMSVKLQHSEFYNSNFLLAVGSKLSILFKNKILCKLGNKKTLFYKFTIRYLVVKSACVNAA